LTTASFRSRRGDGPGSARLSRRTLPEVFIRLVLGRGDYHWIHEPILYGWKPGASHHAVADRTQTTVWDVDRPKSSELHPTMKPLPLIERAIRNSTDSGEVVLDVFGGSGSTPSQRRGPAAER
jgi:hypothetical protein